MNPQGSRPLRVLFVNSGLRFGGAETQIIEIIKELHRRGHQVALYLLTPFAPRAPEITSLGIQVVTDDKRAKLDVGLLSRLRRFVKSWRPDVVHGFLFDGNIYARLASWGCPTVVLNSERSHGYALTASQRLIHVATRPMVDGLVANTHAGRAFAQQVYGYTAPSTHTVWNGVDLAKIDARVAAASTDYRRLWFGRADVKIATIVGTIKAEKDPMLALRVAEQLLDADDRWRVAFVGASYAAVHRSGADKVQASSELEASIKHHWEISRHASRILFAGQRADALEIIAASDVLYSTSRREGFPNVVLEAMSVGTPVVTTAYSDIEQILPDLRFVIGSRDPEAMACAILEADRRRAEIGRMLRAWVEQHATIERSVDALLGAYSCHLAALPRGGAN